MRIECNWRPALKGGGVTCRTVLEHLTKVQAIFNAMAVETDHDDIMIGSSAV